MNDQIRTRCRSMPRYLLVGPIIDAVLRPFLLKQKTASGITEYDDAPEIGGRERKRLTIEKNARLSRRDYHFACTDEEGRGRSVRARLKKGSRCGAHLHAQVCAISVERRALRLIGNHSDAGV